MLIKEIAFHLISVVVFLFYVDKYNLMFANVQLYCINPSMKYNRYRATFTSEFNNINKESLLI